MLWIALGILFGVVLFYGLTNLYAYSCGSGRLFSYEERESVPASDAILELGAGVRGDGTPSHMLEDRLLCALSLYEEGAADSVIVSGDHGSEHYDEVNVMKRYLIERGVPSDRIFMDHAGFSTYDSLFRAKAIFGARSLVVVTQAYHSYRALMIGRHLGLDCSGVSAPILSTDAESYAGQGWYSFRESIARSKDFLFSLFRPNPKYLGDPIPLSGSGDSTNDR